MKDSLSNEMVSIEMSMEIEEITDNSSFFC